MANIRYRKRGNKGLWAYEIRHAGKTIAYNSGFKTLNCQIKCILSP